MHIDASRRTLRVAVALLAAGGLLAAACGSDDDAAESSAGTGQSATSDAPAMADAESSVSGEVVVFAAASLTEAFTELGEAFTEASPDTTVAFNFAASSELVAQIIEGAPADVYASADLTNMTKLTDAGAAAGDPVVFATNESAIIVEPGNPLGIGGIDDLADLAADDLIVVVCAPEVPCGTYAAEIFANAGVTVEADSYEENVKAVVSKVTLGEADAGIAYATDVAAAGDEADGIEIPDDVNVVAEYPIVVTAEASNTAGGQAFIDFVASVDGQAILARYGFSSP